MSSDSEESDGSHFWSRPSSPHETFDNLEGADANGEWQSRHIGHQVDYRGEIIHEVDWTPWKRADGSSTTFENAALTQSDIEEWDEELAEKRLLAANASIVAAPGKHRALSYSLTWNLDQAVEEKLQRLAVNQYDSDSDFDMNVDNGRPPSPVRPASPQRSAQMRPLLRRPVEGGDAVMIPRSQVAKRQSTVSSLSATPPTRFSNPATPPVMASRPDQNRASTASSQGRSSNTPSEARPSASSRSKGKGKARATPQSILRDQIVEEVERSGAAALDFVNEINDELLPALPKGFRYKEQGNDLGPGVRKTSSEFMVSCNCATEGYRCHPRKCNCHDVSEIKVTNKSGHPIFAYDREKKYRFPQVDDSFEVVECNQLCSCDDTCQNRVAQLPRRIPIEIFRTPNRSWGVRSPHPMKAGTVVGTFSGKRQDAENIPDEQRSYCFDLRGKTASTEPGYTEKYTVNAWMTGNWSRFLKYAAGVLVNFLAGCSSFARSHSCKPNLDTVHVVWDTIPEENRPYIAFVANCDILAGIELTLDYHPDLANDDQPKKKRKKRVEDGMIPCDCEAPNCRGWIPGN
ncbi:hypothetical protein GGG16DRAFT_58200 [Schizophyllum commune]